MIMKSTQTLILMFPFGNNISFSNIINNKFYSNDDNYYNIYINSDKTNFIYDCMNNLRYSTCNHKRKAIAMSIEESRNDNYSTDDEGNFTSMDLD